MSETGRDWPWSELAIDPTNDIAAIRSAYAAAIKRTRPDEDAGGFQSLREARDEAVRLAKSDDRDGPPVLENLRVADEPGSRPEITLRPDDHDDGEDYQHRDDDALADTVKAIDALAANPWAYSDVASWQKIMTEAPLLNDRLSARLERHILSLFESWLDGTRQPAAGVILFMDDTFGWSTGRSRLDEFLPWDRAMRLSTILRSLRI